MLRFTEDDLKRLGYIEVSKGKFKKLSEQEAIKVKNDKNPYGHIQRPVATFDGVEYKFRSGWELTYAIYLESLRTAKAIAKWEYEPHRFIFEAIQRGNNSYLPDFKITELDGSHWWAEVKGHFDPKSKTKLKRMKKYFPQERVELITEVDINNLRK